ncbi:MAG: cobalamin-binding protein [Rhodothermales bacterium]
MRIISLLPATTEWVCAFGAEKDLVGRSHECDFPASVRALPPVTRAPAFSGDSAEIDQQVQGQFEQGLSLYDVDLDALRTLRPDVVLTQAQCEVCAVSLHQLEAALQQWTSSRPAVVSIEPMTLKQVLDAGLRIGRAIGRFEAAMHFIAEQEMRLERLRRRLGNKRTSVAFIEWMEGLMTAGHWMPDVIAQAGGEAVLAERGARSRYIEWDALREADPDVLAVGPCGFSLEATRRDLHYLTRRAGWADLRAVREGRVFLFDGNAYFNRPGPRLYRAIELLAAALHPDVVAWEAIGVAPWEMERWPGGG